MVIQATQNDVIFLGHGFYLGGANTGGRDKNVNLQNNVDLPNNVDFYLLEPIGAKLDARLADDLIHQERTDISLFHRDGSADSDISKSFPHVYNTTCPNFILQDLGPELKKKLKLANLPPVGSPYIVLVSQDTPLSDLLNRDDVSRLIKEHQQSNTRLRIFWAACASQDEPSETSVVLKRS